MKNFINFILVLSFLVIHLSSCNTNQNDKSYVKKIELKQETIAVGIYKANGVDLLNIEYINEAIKIDAGLVYVTLTDSDILRSNLDNIDVVIFPEITDGSNYNDLDPKMVKIFKDFIIKKGKGAIGFSNGIKLLAINEECKSLNLVQVRAIDIDKGYTEGLIRFSVTEACESIFPELRNQEKSFINYKQGTGIDFLEDANGNCQLIANTAGSEDMLPLFVLAQNGKGNVFLCLARPECTPGMRWMIPRMVRIVNDKERIPYNVNVFRPKLYSNEIVFTETFYQELDLLKSQLKNGQKDEKLAAMERLENLYPWLAAENVKALLYEKNDEIKIRAAKFLVNIEYTLAIADLKMAVNKERNQKVKTQLLDYTAQLVNMLEQN